jgi:hypothetical protein
MERQLVRLELDSVTQKETLARLTRSQKPAATAHFRKDLAFYLQEIQENGEKIQSFLVREAELRRQIAASTLHPRYRDAIVLCHELEQVVDTRKRLRVLVNNTKLAFHVIRPSAPLLNEAPTRECVSLKQKSR